MRVLAAITTCIGGSSQDFHYLHHPLEFVEALKMVDFELRLTYPRAQLSPQYSCHSAFLCPSYMDDANRYRR